MDEQMKKKLDELIAAGINPFPYRFDATHHSNDIKDNFAELEGKEVSVAGRVLQIRSFGKLVFSVLRDSKGKIQIVATKSDLKNFDLFEKLDPGDIIGVRGKVIRTKKGEISVSAEHFEILSKALNMIPEKFHGLQDVEARYRKRYLDLIMSEESYNKFVIRTRMISLMREFLDKRGFLEVETPVLQPIYGGASARPFKTHHNAMDCDLYLRIADELYLKRLIIGGMEKVYEISKDFRNEDIDSTHNPEFTQIELYQAYVDYNDMMKLTEDLFQFMVKSIFGKDAITYQDKEISFAAPFKRVSIVDELKKKTGIDVSEFKTDEEAVDAAEKLGLKIAKRTRDRVVDAMFDHFIQPELVNPTFVIDFPYYMCPLAKSKRGNPRLGERFEMNLAARECANCYSELNDPIEQKRKLLDQSEERKKGDEEAQPYDEDFIEAMEQGMPPTGGLGIGIDRVAMILTNSVSIKEVILFPTVKPEQQDEVKE